MQFGSFQTFGIILTSLLLSSCQNSFLPFNSAKQTTTLYSYPHRTIIHKYEVIDGDTLNVYDENNQKTRVRLTGIDAPESKQIYGIESIKQLKKCLANNSITLNWANKDHYNRLLAKVIADGKDCNLKQIETGMAWHYKHFEKDQPDLDRYQYTQAEIIAKQHALGIWSDACPTPPWDWRKNKNLLCNK